MAEAVQGSVIASHNLACCSGTSTKASAAVCRQVVSAFRWQRIPPKVHGGGSRHCLRAAKNRRTTGMRLTSGVARAAKNPMDDPFDFGEDEDLEFGDIMTEGKQGLELPRARTDDQSPYGFLDFPAYHNVELSTLGLYVRQDVRRCLCWVAGGVYENLLFFPAIQLLKARYPGVKIDIVASARGKQVYEMNKYVNKTLVFDVDAEWTVPADFTEFLGVLRGEYYDMILSTKHAGFKHGATLYMIGGRTRRISYVNSNQPEWVSKTFLTQTLEAPRENLADAGYHMYKEMLDYLAQPGKSVPQQEIPSLQIGVSKRVRSVTIEKYKEAGVDAGKYVVFHGIESDSAASMQSKGDSDSLLPLQFWGRLKNSVGTSVVVVIPHEKERKKVIEACGDDVHIVFITTPGQLGALIRDSAGVVSTNTAAAQMAIALKKPSVALFGTEEKASIFIPPVADKCKAITSKTGKLIDIEIDEAVAAWRTVSQGQLVLAA